MYPLSYLARIQDPGPGPSTGWDPHVLFFVSLVWAIYLCLLGPVVAAAADVVSFFVLFLSYPDSSVRSSSQA